MKLIKILASTAVLSSFTATASAQDVSTYGNIGVEVVDFFGTSGNIVGRFGIDLHKNFALEGEGSFGVLESDEGFKLGHKGASYARFKAPVSDQVEAFARVGYFTSKAEGETADGLAVGAGIEFFPLEDKKHSVRAEYTNLNVNANAANVFSIAYGIRF